MLTKTTLQLCTGDFSTLDFSLVLALSGSMPESAAARNRISSQFVGVSSTEVSSVKLDS